MNGGSEEGSLLEAAGDTWGRNARGRFSLLPKGMGCH